MTSPSARPPTHPGRSRAPGVQRYLWPALALLWALVAAAPLLWGPGMVYTRAGGDSPFLLQRTQQLAAALSGSLPVRWMPDAAHGLGYPFYNYYAALPYYAAAVLHRLGAGLVASVQATQVLALALAAVALYLLARHLGASAPAAMLASAAYTFTPFHLVNLYVRGDALSELWAYAFLPLALWAVELACTRPTPARLAFLAGAYGGLVLCHNISALLATPLVGLWWLVAVCRRPDPERGRALWAGGLGLGLGLLATAWFWLPALHEQPYVQLEEQTTGYLHYQGHFLRDGLVQLRLVHDYTIVGRAHPFRMGLAQALLGLAGLVGVAWRLLRRRLEAWCWPALASLATATWLMLPSSEPVWEALPLLEYTQFPWRLLSLQALPLSLLVGPLISGASPRPRALLSLVLAAGLALAGMGGLEVERLALTDDDLTVERWLIYETYSGNLGTTIRHEYLPREMVPRPHAGQAQLGRAALPLVLEGAVERVELVDRAPTAETWRLTVGEPALLAMPRAFFPGWRALVNGAEQGVLPLAGLGQVGLRLPPGEHEVRLWLGDTRARRWAGIAGGAGVLAWLALAAYALARSARARRAAAGAAGGLAVLVAGTVALSALQSPAAAGPLVMDATHAPLLHHEPEGLWLGDARLAHYDQHPQEVLEPGQPLMLRLTWYPPAEGHRLRAELVALTAHLYAPAPVWASAEEELGGRTVVELALPTPADLPPGLYAVRLSVRAHGEGQPARRASGQWLGALSLQPVRVEAAVDAPVDAPSIASYGPEAVPPVISLLAAEARLARPDLVEVDLSWRSERQAPLNYALSLRLIGANGQRLASRDLPPLLGVYPTSLWRPGELVSDRVLLPLPEPMEACGGCALEVVLYDRATLRGAGEGRLPADLR